MINFVWKCRVLDFFVFQIRKIRGATNQEIAAAEVERSAHRETLESLELSETSVSVRCLYPFLESQI